MTRTNRWNPKNWMTRLDGQISLFKRMRIVCHASETCSHKQRIPRRPIGERLTAFEELYVLIVNRPSLFVILTI